MSFCRITGKSRGLPKPNYFPLLQPISPADAKRFCKITGKAYGLPSHHYIPVILKAYSKKRSQGKNGISKNYGRRKHMLLADFRYVFPVFDETNEKQRNFKESMHAAQVDPAIGEDRFVYRVGERKLNLVFPAQLEAAVRSGDVRDVLVGADSDTLLLKMRQGRNVTLELHDFDVVQNQLFDGEGPRHEVVVEQEKEERDRKRRQNERGLGKVGTLSQMANIFEKKERLQEEQQAVQEVSLEKIKKRRKLDGPRKVQQQNAVDFESAEDVAAMLSECSTFLASGEWRDLVKPLIESLDWNAYEKEAQADNIRPWTEGLPSGCKVKPSMLDAIQIKFDANILSGTSGFDAIPCIGNLSLNAYRITDELIHTIHNLDKQCLTSTHGIHTLNPTYIPSSSDLLNILLHFKNGNPDTIDSKTGLSILLDSGKQVFIPGQAVQTASGRQFIPGQTRESATGATFVPGLTITDEQGQLTFVPGVVHAPTSPGGASTFEAGHIVQSQFQSGQSRITSRGDVQFICGQTVTTKDGLRFVPGQVDPQNGLFIPGQTVMVNENELKFVPGHTINTSSGVRFVAGMNQFDKETGWSFVPGQIVDSAFVAGISVIRPEGSKFVPGQYVGETFVPGITKEGNFVPGLNVETKVGAKFIEGQIIESVHGPIFMPGQSDSGVFAVAKTVDEMRIHQPITNELVLDSRDMTIAKPSLSVFGHMVQTDQCIEFYPDNIQLDRLPAGKVIPGKLIKQDANTKFVPGIVDTEGFIPGQVVWTEKGEQFVPGQVIETEEGLKFVPGQVIETKAGSKFVPGQTVQTPDGARFVPGQIVQTKLGPTFIPGQVIHTDEEGERFVPGQVVDTEDGPRFVPGRVVETGDKVTFIPGQIVQTEQGPRFVAPDLSDIEGEQHFSVQSFLINPEELSLLKPSHTWTPLQTDDDGSSRGELSIDSHMLRQLSEAGMKIGRQIEASAVDIVLQSTRERKIVEAVAFKLGLTEHAVQTLHSALNEFKLLIGANSGGKTNRTGIAATQKSATTTNCLTNNNHEPSSHQQTQLVDVFVNALLAVITTKTPMARNNTLGCDASAALYELISDALTMKWAQGSSSVFVDGGGDANNNQTDGKSVAELLNNMTKDAFNALMQQVHQQVDRELQTRERKEMFSFLKATLSDRQLPDAKRLENICGLLCDKTETAQIIGHLVDSDSKILRKILDGLQVDVLSPLDATASIADFLEQSIIQAVQATADEDMQNVFNRNHPDELKILLTNAVALSKALGDSQLTEVLARAVSNPKNRLQVLQQTAAKELIQRTLVMHKLAAGRPNLQQSLANMVTDPYASRKDSAIRDLLRQSGVVTIAKANDTLTNSNDVPLSVICSENQLAVEDFLLRSHTSRRGAFVIVKDGYQAVVPRESSRDVLTGKCAYTVLDETGIRHFEPLHVFSALKLAVAHRFSIYSCEMANDEEATTNTFAVEAVNRTQPQQQCNNGAEHSSEIDQARGANSSNAPSNGFAHQPSNTNTIPDQQPFISAKVDHNVTPPNDTQTVTKTTTVNANDGDLRQVKEQRRRQHRDDDKTADGDEYCISTTSAANDDDDDDTTLSGGISTATTRILRSRRQLQSYLQRRRGDGKVSSTHI